MIKRLFFLVFFTMLIARPCLGQKEKESYKKSLSSRTSAEQLVNEAELLTVANPDAALDKVQQALAISVALEDAFNEGRAYILLAEVNEGILEWKLAYENYLRAKDKLASDTNSPEYVATLRGLGNMGLKLRDYTSALQYYQDALTLRLSSAERMEFTIAVSEVYYQMRSYQEALSVLDSAYQVPKIQNPQFENQCKKINVRLDGLDKNPNLYSNSLNTIRSGNSVSSQEQQSVQQTKDEIVEVLQQNKLYDEEIHLRKQSIEFNTELNNLAEVSKDRVAISKNLNAKGETSAAIKEAEEAARIATTIDNPLTEASAFLSLADLYEKNGRTSKALSAYKKYSDAISRKEAQSESRLVEKSELIRKQKAIEEYTKDVSIGQREETIEQATVFRQQLVIYGLLVIILIIGVTSFFIYKNAQASKLANRLLALKSLRGQMNPHFIFNALNSVNQFISQQDERTANRFLSEFALLMRLVLENSQEDFIPLQKEQEILSLYLKLEHYRFRDKFDYEIKVDENVNPEAIQIPPMLIQPYIENAVWHGLRYKNEKGKLLLHFYRQNGNLVAEITDDGVGRQRSAELKTENQKKHNSTGLKNIEERLAIINKVYRLDCRVHIEDRGNNGTQVSVYLPVTKQS
ncbi:MAG TPA: histidine kinase [Chryseolinea sp.]|nr:histidine kinase [Chryseolinea sp.]